MNTKRMSRFLLLLILSLAACQSPPAVSPTHEALPPANPNILFPGDIKVGYEVIGQVEVTKKKSSAGGVFEELSKECGKMGGDMVINVETDQGVADSTAVPHFAKGEGEAAYGPRYAVPYSWGKGTVVKIKDEDKRKAYQEAVGRGDLEGACEIVGVPLPKK